MLMIEYDFTVFKNDLVFKNDFILLKIN